MVDLNDPLTQACVASVLFGIALYVRPLKLPFLLATLRISAFAVLTAALLHAGISPTRPMPAWTSVIRHGVGQILVGFWWFGAAAVVNSVVRRLAQNSPPSCTRAADPGHRGDARLYPRGATDQR
jgi:predicted membrane protein